MSQITYTNKMSMRVVYSNWTADRTIRFARHYAHRSKVHRARCRQKTKLSPFSVQHKNVRMMMEIGGKSVKKKYIYIHRTNCDSDDWNLINYCVYTAHTVECFGYHQFIVVRTYRKCNFIAMAPILLMRPNI